MYSDLFGERPTGRALPGFDTACIGRRPQIPATCTPEVGLRVQISLCGLNYPFVGHVHRMQECEQGALDGLYWRVSDLERVRPS